MQQGLIDRLGALAERHEELGVLLADPQVLADQPRFRQIAKEHADLTPLVRCLDAYSAARDDLAAALDMEQEGDAELRALGAEEAAAARGRIEQLEAELQRFLIPRDPFDAGNIFLEIRSGTGGDEAALFAGDLYRMYGRYAERQGWRLELLSAHDGEQGGYRELILRVVGDGAYSRLKFESGGHRVQRVPVTESQGRIHTSACTVAVLPEVDEVQGIDIDPGDLRVDTYRASGAGGQHVNKTDSAIRITHLPTGTVVECQDERSQHKNRARAMALLQARLLEAERTRQRDEQAATRKSLVGSGDRSERIRTYNFPQGRVTDHRINLTLYKLDQVLEGALDDVIEPLLHEHEAQQLLALEP